MSPHPFPLIRQALKIAAILGSSGMGSFASAALFLDPSTGVERTYTVNEHNDGYAYGSRPIDGLFFGQDISLIVPTISLNGHVLFGAGDGNNDYFVWNLGDSGLSRITPMWYDFDIGALSRVIENSSSTFYAISWLDLTIDELPGELASFQMIFFESATTLNGLDFAAGDIVFSYGNIGFYTQVGEIVSGLENEGEFAGVPNIYGDFQGWHSYGATGDFPVEDNQYVHFRPDGLGNYTVSIETVPEPSVSLLLAGGALALLRRNRHKSAA